MVTTLESRSSNALDPALFAGDIRLSLDKMLASTAFERTERPGRFLRYLIENTLAGRSRVLKESVIGCEVFERPCDWDPRIDPIVRQEAGRLRKRMAKYYEVIAEPDQVRIELPVGSYVPLFYREAAAVRQELPATDFENISVYKGWPPTTIVEQATSAKKRPAGKKALLLYTGLGVLVASAFAAVMLWRHGTAQASTRIAVVPFANATGDPADQYFADGFSSEIADSCGRFKNVQVIQAAQFRFHRQDKSPNWRSLALQARAEYLLEGSVERQGDRVKLVARLVDTERGKELWTNRYRRSAADVSAIEASVAQSTADALHLTVADASGPAPHIPSALAHDSVLKANYEMNLATSQDNALSQRDFRRAIALDPEYAAAYSGLAQAIWNENIVAGRRPAVEQRRKSEELWEKALQLDPTYSAAHSGLAYYALQYDWDWKRSERELRAALAANDNSSAEENYAALCLILGRREEAEHHLRHAREISPNDPNHLANQINVMMLAGDLPAAENESKRLMALKPGAMGPKLIMAEILSDERKEWDALRLLESLPAVNPRVQMAMAAVKARAGDRAAALRMLVPLEQDVEVNRMFYYDFAVAYAAMGDAENCVKWMKRSMDAREGPALYIRVDPELAAVQNDPAFRGLKKQIGLDW